MRACMWTISLTKQVDNPRRKFHVQRAVIPLGDFDPGDVLLVSVSYEGVFVAVTRIHVNRILAQIFSLLQHNP